ncbi:Fatty acid hydroxylase superfamily protein [Nocardioides dokdonensis FR1436]|uniref:Fatty acid hydroxylase superfamily protein n=1 Tax=Nocardioides dokdonensis FR1436 TaxID=1300347 RepID=A0A1A9GQ08_9ACTN|nr:sterol desaturase family protein [Nocardioides dokdonensis]ANH39750.1 Fatty acid hydroxylase superfamily protein [Nocardioides dokdonensis FR1436]
MLETLSGLWDALPEALRDPVALAAPFFVLMIGLEALAALLLEDDEQPAGERRTSDGRAAPRRGGYERRDALTSLTLGVVSAATMAAWKGLGLLGYAVLFAYVAPWQLPADAWWTWALAILGVDFLFYWAHRIAHRVRLVWATHQAHHSSEYFNFSTALRQKWNNSHELVLWAPLPLLGVPPALVFLGFSVSLVYQFFVHTERVGRLWRPVELVLNTPSHHRVHHGSDPEYLDRNYGGILIVWDRLFGSFQPELHRPTYGLTVPVGTYHLLRLQTHEYAAIGRDVRRAGTWRDKVGYVLGPPGWRPAADRVDA